MNAMAASAANAFVRPRSRTAAARAPLALPLDVRLMNGVASGIFALAGIGLVAAAVLWATRAPAFTIRAIALDGDLARNNVNTVRANAMPQMRGNFFSVSLADTQAAFESVPWVRNAVVRRVWPNRLAVTLEEHQAAAIWRGEDGNDRLVNRQGEVFDANVGDVEDEGLPQFTGPEGSSAAMLAMWRRLAPVFETLRDEVRALHLSGRGSWRVELAGGAALELGRGSEDEVHARTERFARTVGSVAGRFANAPLVAADLRHPDGYALRLRGVSTTDSASPNRPPSRTTP